MRRPLALLAVTLALVTVAHPASGAAAAATSVPASDLFGLSRVLQVELRLTPDDWERMQPSGPPQPQPGASPFRPSARPGGSNAAKKKGGPPAHRTMLGMEYPIVHAALKVDQTEYLDVALRFKGNFTYTASARGLNRPFRVDMNRFVKGQAIGGISKFSLNNNVTDPSRMREALAYGVFREAGVPAPRTAFARVYLTVPGRIERQSLGVYTLVEAVDERFLKAKVGSGEGLLLKPQFQGLDYLGDEWAPYAARFGDGVKGGASEASTARYVALARLVNRGDDAAFRQNIAGLVDVDEFLRFLAVNALLVNLDSFLAMGQNYYLYHDPGKDRFSWIPWDLDLAFGAWPMGGPPEQQADLSIFHPYAGQNRMIERLLSIPEHRAAYVARVRELLHGAFSVQRLNAQLDMARPAIRAALADEGPAALQAFDRATGAASGASPAVRPEAPPRPGEGSPFGMPSLPLPSFFRQRVQSVNSQLAGTRTGYLVRLQRPDGGMPDSPGQALGRGLFQAADRDHDGRVTSTELSGMVEGWGTTWDTDRSRSLDIREVASGLNSVFGLPPGDPRLGVGGGQGPAGGPGGVLGPPLLRAADANHDGRLTGGELAAAARQWLRQWDGDRNGQLSPEEIGAGLSTPEFVGH